MSNLLKQSAVLTTMMAALSLLAPAHVYAVVAPHAGTSAAEAQSSTFYERGRGGGGGSRGGGARSGGGGGGGRSAGSVRASSGSSVNHRASRPDRGGASAGSRPAASTGAGRTGGGRAAGEGRAAAGDRNRTNVDNSRRNNVSNRENNISNRNNNINIDNDTNINIDNDHGWGGDWDNHWHPVATAAAIGVTAAVIGSIVYSVPPSCVTTMYGGVSYSQCGSTWYQPRYVGSSVEYVVVNQPY